MHVREPLSITEQLQHATELHQQGQLADAERVYMQILRKEARHFIALHRLAILSLQQGRLEEALQRVDAALEVDPQVSALINKGTILLALKRHDDALALYGKVLTRNPADADAHFNLGNALIAAGRPGDAAQSFARCHSLRPRDIEALRRQADALTKAGCFEAAIESLDRAIAIEAEALHLHHDRAAVLTRLQRHQDAGAAYDGILMRNRNDTVAMNNKGLVLLELGRPQEALASFESATGIKPRDPQLWYNRGVALSPLQQIESALESYDQVLAIDPKHALSLINRGNLLGTLNRTQEALACYERALQFEPNNALALNNRGAALRELGRPEEALASYDRAIALTPHNAVAHSNRGLMLNFLGRPEAALQSYERAKELDPAALEHAVHSLLLLPVIPGTLEEISSWRARYQAGITALSDAGGSLDDPGEKLTVWSFQLAYHNCNDRPVMEALCQRFRSRVPTLTATAPHVPSWRAAQIKNRRIRVGFLSEFFVNHTIGKLYHGIIRHLDRNRFEVLVIHTPKSKSDPFRESLDASANSTLSLPNGLIAQQEAVAGARLDVLFYPDIGMSSSTYFLAYARLAPVQLASWGHPVTTGLDTIDYFVSASSIESEDSQSHYTEKLVCFNRMPCFYPAIVAPTRVTTRAALGLPETGTLYGCPQSLFKIHPDFDVILADIALGDPTGRIILLEGLYPAWRGRLEIRWRKTFPYLLKSVVFLPRLSSERFLELMSHMDVLLDPIYFGSGNSMYEAM